VQKPVAAEKPEKPAEPQVTASVRPVERAAPRPAQTHSPRPREPQVLSEREWRRMTPRQRQLWADRQMLRLKELKHSKRESAVRAQPKQAKAKPTKAEIALRAKQELQKKQKDARLKREIARPTLRQQRMQKKPEPRRIASAPVGPRYYRAGSVPPRGARFTDAWR
jgi:hypothetical protein